MVVKVILAMLRNVNQFRNMSQGHNQELTDFLKSNPGFKALCWKVFHFKKNFIKKLDEHILDDDPNNTDQKNVKIHEIDFNKKQKKK
jgi:hypothetical protein